jgi:hypothetical protein
MYLPRSLEDHEWGDEGGVGREKTGREKRENRKREERKQEERREKMGR